MTNFTNTNTSSTAFEKNKVSITDEESDKSFNPSPLRVKKGDTVIWISRCQKVAYRHKGHES